MINDLKIDFHLSGDTELKGLNSEFESKYGPYKNIVSTIATLNRHVEQFYIVIQISNKPPVNARRFDVKFPTFMESLTKRELQVYGLAIKGTSNKSIADQLFISVETVKCHRKSIVKKAGVKKIEEIKDLLLELNNVIEYTKITSQG